MHKDEITESLRDYRSYRYAVSQYERHKPHPSAGIANYDAMPGGSGAPELFFTANGRMADMGRTSLQDRMDYQAYKTFIDEIEGALDTLSEDERYVIRLKWIDGVNLGDIAERKGISERTIKTMHKRALKKLEVCFRFVQKPEIVGHSRRGGEHLHHVETRMYHNL